MSHKRKIWPVTITVGDQKPIRFSGILISIAVAVLLITILIFLLWMGPSWLLNHDFRAAYLRPKDYFDVANSIRGAFISAIGVPLAIGALLFTWRQLATTRNQAEETNERTLEQLTLARRAQIAERFTKAVDQLGHAALDVQIGGIYALGQIMQEPNTEEYHKPIIEILAAYLRNHHPWPARDKKGDFTDDSHYSGGRATLSAPADIHAVISILRQHHMYAPNKTPSVLSIGRVDLRHVDFTGMDLRESQLQDSNCSWAGLQGTHFEGAKLEGVILNNADLRGAIFNNAHLDAAELRHAHLADIGQPATRAKFENTDIRASNFTDAKGLEDSDYVQEIIAHLGDNHIGEVSGHSDRGTTRPQSLVDRYLEYKQKQP